MKTKRIVAAMLFSVTLAGCGIAQRMEAEKKAQELTAQMNAATAACQSRFPVEDPKTFVAKVKCLNDAAAIGLPTVGSDQDLIVAFMAQRAAIAERVGKGQTTLTQGESEIAEKWSQVVSESQNRRNARVGVAAQVLGATAAQQSAAAQQQAASAAAMRVLNPPMTPPVTCMTTGNMTTCH